MAQEYVDIYDLKLMHSTSKAYLIHNEDNEEFWIPISQVEYIEFGKDFNDEESGRACREINRLTIPEWLADKHGMI